MWVWECGSGVEVFLFEVRVLRLIFLKVFVKECLLIFFLVDEEWEYLLELA